MSHAHEEARDKEASVFLTIVLVAFGAGIVIGAALTCIGFAIGAVR